MISSHFLPRRGIGDVANLTSPGLTRRSPGRPRGMLVQEGFLKKKLKKKVRKQTSDVLEEPEAKMTPAPLARLMLFKAAGAGEVVQCPFC